MKRGFVRMCQIRQVHFMQAWDKWNKILNRWAGETYDLHHPTVKNAEALYAHQWFLSWIPQGILPPAGMGTPLSWILWAAVLYKRPWLYYRIDFYHLQLMTFESYRNVSHIIPYYADFACHMSGTSWISLPTPAAAGFIDGELLSYRKGMKNLPASTPYHCLGVHMPPLRRSPENKAPKGMPRSRPFLHLLVEYNLPHDSARPRAILWVIRWQIISCTIYRTISRDLSMDTISDCLHHG